MYDIQTIEYEVALGVIISTVIEFVSPENGDNLNYNKSNGEVEVVFNFEKLESKHNRGDTKTFINH